jgi:hypothetical protein
MAEINLADYPNLNNWATAISNKVMVWTPTTPRGINVPEWEC